MHRAEVLEHDFPGSSGATSDDQRAKRDIILRGHCGRDER
jgi:hypothetical protein